MAVTRSTSSERVTVRAAARQRAGWRVRELLGLLAAGALAGAGLYLVFQAKAPKPGDIEAGLASKRLLNLNDLNAREDLLPALTMFTQPAERDFVARKIYYVSGGLSNVGAIGRIRYTAEEVGARGLRSFHDRLSDRASAALLTPDQVRQLKPLLVVRTAAAFRRQFWQWSILFFAAFLLAHAFLSLRGFRGDQ
ncbi:MAG TPA: hypothetical protein VGS58_05530, partial [Candidatus Sulfopaludibacter sp.]|nr:hypothetical protein [Candidatus Sulfopaludibacter sp.]